MELLSPSDRANKTRAKVRDWIKNGALLGWMAGEWPIEGSVLDLGPIWERDLGRERPQPSGALASAAEKYAASG